jgi:glycosyltransferase involved in cell wall biosynthesis
MVDLATLKGLIPALAERPSIYYFHENQLAYPVLPGQVESIEPVMVQLYGALAADRLAFNSRHNRDSFLAGLHTLTSRMPDGMPPDLPERLAARSRILPVAVDPIPPGPSKDPRLLLWNHRWEHDKAPELFADAVLDLARSGREFRLALLGPRPGREPAELRRLRDALGGRIVADGFLDREAYLRWLQRAGLVVSTARHEFQGISLLEAVSAGAWPIVPDALCYPEQYPRECRYPWQSSHALCRMLALALDAPPTTAPSVEDWLGPALRPRWRELLATA